MTERWSPRVEWPDGLARPVEVDPSGAAGPTRFQTRGPLWERSSRGLYVPAGVDRDLVEQRIVEQAARLPAGGAVTGWAALRVAGGKYFDGLAPDGTTRLPVPLAVPPTSCLAAGRGAMILRADLPKEAIHEVNGIRCTLPPRAVFDEIRRQDDLRERVVVLDMAVVAGFVTLREVDDFIGAYAGRPAVERLREARALAVDRSASPMETRMRLVWILDAGLPHPRCNWPIADRNGRYLGKPDLLVELLAVFGEYDGREHRSGPRHAVDVGRFEDFIGTGLEGFVVVGRDMANRDLVVRRMHAAVSRAASSPRPRTWMLRANPKPLWP